MLVSCYTIIIENNFGMISRMHGCPFDEPSRTETHPTWHIEPLLAKIKTRKNYEELRKARHKGSVNLRIHEL